MFPHSNTTGKGFASIESEWSSLSVPAQTALQGLFTEHGVVIRQPRNLRRRRPRPERILADSMTESEILELAPKGEISLLGSLLRVVHENKTAVTTRQLIKAGSLTVVPASTPGNMDARDMVVAAALFLCSKTYLKCNNPDEPAEKRVFTKAWPWKWGEVAEHVTGELEDAFYEDDPHHYAWLNRERFVPTQGVDPNVLQQLMVKGATTKTGGATKKKPASNRKKSKKNPDTNGGANVTTEASRIVNETHGSDSS